VARKSAPEKGKPGSDKISPWFWVGVGAVLVALIAAWALLPVKDWLEALQAWLRNFGVGGALIFCLIYIAAVVVFAPGSLLSITAGLAYGVWGIPLAIVAATCGASLSFLISRYVMRAKIRAVLARHMRLKAVQDAVDEEGWKIVALLRLSPLVPFNLQNYAFGITNIPFLQFASATFLGIMPGAVAYVYLGIIGGATGEDELGAPQWGLLGLGLVASVLVAFLVARKAREKLRTAGIGAAGPGNKDKRGSR